jgi:hypothetical protein
MSKLNKSSKSPKSTSSASGSATSKSSAKEPQKLELVKLISPTPITDPASDPASQTATESKVEAVESIQETTTAEPTAEPTVQPDEVSSQLSPDYSERTLPIPPATEPMQYRAIGLVQGRYTPEEDQFSKGFIVTPDGTTIDAVLLGKVISIVKKRLDLEKDYYWVVYPRTRDKAGDLHIQIAGVWAPMEMGKAEQQAAEPSVDDGYFSVRGEVIAQSLEDNQVFIKVRRSGPNSSKPVPPKKDGAKSITKFKICLSGILPTNAVGQFWDINAQRQGNVLKILDANFIANIPAKPPRKSFRKPDARSSGGFKPKPRKYGDQVSQGSGIGEAIGKPIRQPRPTSEPPTRPVLKKRPDA